MVPFSSEMAPFYQKRLSSCLWRRLSDQTWRPSCWWRRPSDQKRRFLAVSAPFSSVTAPFSPKTAPLPMMTTFRPEIALSWLVMPPSDCCYWRKGIDIGAPAPSAQERPLSLERGSEPRSPPPRWIRPWVGGAVQHGDPPRDTKLRPWPSHFIHHVDQLVTPLVPAGGSPSSRRSGTRYLPGFWDLWWSLANGSSSPRQLKVRGPDLNFVDHPVIPNLKVRLCSTSST